MKNLKNIIFALSMLLSAQAAFSATPEQQRELIDIANIGDQKSLSHLLENRSLDVNHRDWTGKTALMYAIIGDSKNEQIRYQKIQALLQAHANPNIQDGTGMTALMYAAQAGLRGTVEELLAHGANRNVRNAYGQTAADLAKNEEIRRIISK